jgi:hypothetical protein
MSSESSIVSSSKYTPKNPSKGLHDPFLYPPGINRITVSNFLISEEVMFTAALSSPNDLDD